MKGVVMWRISAQEKYYMKFILIIFWDKKLCWNFFEINKKLNGVRNLKDKNKIIQKRFFNNDRNPIISDFDKSKFLTLCTQKKWLVSNWEPIIICKNNFPTF